MLNPAAVAFDRALEAIQASMMADDESEAPEGWRVAETSTEDE